MASSIQVVSYAYAVILMIGGIMGFLKAQSMMSLGMGIGAGVIMAVLEMQGSSIFKTWAQVALSMGLAVVMGIRFQATNKFMPAGLVCVLSVAMALVYLLRPAKSALRARPSKAE